MGARGKREKRKSKFSLRGETDYTSRAKPKDISRVKVVLCVLNGTRRWKIEVHMRRARERSGQA